MVVKTGVGGAVEKLVESVGLEPGKIGTPNGVEIVRI